MYNHTMVIYTQHKFHGFQPLLAKLWLGIEKKSLKCRQSKGYNSSITDGTLVKLDVHKLNHTMVMIHVYMYMIHVYLQ